MSWSSQNRSLWNRMKLSNFSPLMICTLAVGASYTGYLFYTPQKAKDTKKRYYTCAHEKRFRNFASLQYKGILFMTPSDFINSLIKDVPTRRQLVSIEERDLNVFLKQTPMKNKVSSNLFRQIKNHGVLSYSEYLFLLQILTKPHSGFEIAFKMLDTDLNGSVDAEEFAKLNQVIAQTAMQGAQTDAPCDLTLPSDEVFRTTLMTHLFGRNQDSPLTYEEFIRFMNNVQNEALDVEFRSYSSGLPSISPTDFAQIILRHTTLSKEDRERRINQLRERLVGPVPITFDEFRKFFGFLNSLDDFSMAMKLYTIAERPISLSEFQRAVKACTGYELSLDVLTAVFALFDVDNDGRLSYEEFIQIMRERHARRIQESTHTVSRSEAFRQCVTRKLRNTQL